MLSSFQISMVLQILNRTANYLAMRNAIRSLLSSREDISLVGEASNFLEMIEKTSELHPDLLILDLHLAGRNHIAPSEAKRLLHGTKILAITMGTDDLDDPAEEL